MAGEAACYALRLMKHEWPGVKLSCRVSLMELRVLRACNVSPCCSNSLVVFLTGDGTLTVQCMFGACSLWLHMVLWELR